MNFKKDYSFIIIGGGIAAVSCAESLPFWAPNEPFLLISASPVIKSVTNLINITKTLVQFNIEEKNINSLENVTSLIDFVVKIDSEKKIVFTKKGFQFGYKKLCVCTGGKPRLIADNEFILGIRDTDSVMNFKNRLNKAKKVMIVGNGGIATELVYEIKNIEIIWVIKDNHISSTFVDETAGEFLKNCLENHQTGEVTIKKLSYSSEGNAALGPSWHSRFNFQGIENRTLKIEYNTSIDTFTTQSNGILVKLDNGNEYFCDFLISATGVVPNGNTIEVLPNGFDLHDDNGIKVNEFLQTNIKDIFAAGDVVHANWKLAPHWLQMRLWTQARQMGQYAAKSMAMELQNEPVLQDFCFELFSHVTSFFGFKVILLGLFNAQQLNEFELLLRITEGKEFVKLILKDGRLQGAILIGDTDLEEMCENLILNQIDLTPFGEDLLDPNIDIDDYFD